jgi:hypothetical protein
MHSWHTDIVNSSDQHLKFAIYEGENILTIQDFLNKLKDSHSFRNWYSSSLIDSRFEAFFWENRPFTSKTLAKPYECNVISSTYLANRSPDRETFSRYFDTDKSVVCFQNLGNDATLIAPVPEKPEDDFTHIGLFLRKADQKQISEFWKVAANETLKRISDKPVWLSTSGLGVYWLHARVDTVPKYYQTADYKTI